RRASRRSRRGRSDGHAVPGGGMNEVLHFLTGMELSADETRDLLALAEALRTERAHGIARRDLAGKSLVLLFEKPSLRTHMSFTVAMQELGGQVIESFGFQRKHEEPEDVGRVLAGYCSA